MLLALAFSMAAVGQANMGGCVGDMLSAASYITASGMQLAVVADACKPGCHQEKCEAQVVSFMATLSKSADILQVGVKACGGSSDACGLGATRVFEQVVNLVSAVDGIRAKGGLTGKNMQVLADEFTLAGTAMTNSAKTCASNPETIKENLGYCVSKTMESATQVAAAGIQWDIAKNGACAGDDGDDVSDQCRMNQAFIMQALSKASERAVGASKDCESNGLLDCGMDIATTSAKLAQASQFAIQAKVNSPDGKVTTGMLANLDSVGAQIGAASAAIGSAATTCSRNGETPEVKAGHCTADAITATAYVASASVGIGVAVKDCCEKHTQSRAGLAQCVTDVAYTIQNYARTTNEIIWATQDCAADATMNTQCGSDIATAISAVAAASAGAAHIAAFAAKGDWSSTQGEFQSLGDSLMALGQKVGGAVSQCVEAPPAAGATFDPPNVIGSLPVTGGHPATTNAHTAGVSGFWGVEGKKWLNMHAEKQSVEDTLGKYMVPAAAGAMALVLLSIVTVSARALSRRPARASPQAVSAREDDQLLEELSTVES